MFRLVVCIAVAWGVLTAVSRAMPNSESESVLEVGFSSADITPQVAPEKPVWMAGYVPGRAATGVHDPLFARCAVMRSGSRKIALVSLDLIGLQYPAVLKIRNALSGFDYVMVCSTHNHEGPDVIGVWGKSVFQRGVDEAYLKSVIDKVVELVHVADGRLTRVVADFGTAEDSSLLNDSREPFVKDGVLRVLRFTSWDGGRPTGLVVQWNCHPEALGSRNTLITADYPAATVDELSRRYSCPVVLVVGAIGGLLAPPSDRIADDSGKMLGSGDFEFARRYGIAVADLADKAIAASRRIELTPFAIAARPVVIQVENPWYRAARVFGVIRRQGRVWTGDSEQLGDPVTAENAEQPTGVETEVGCLKLGSLRIAAIPGELYPELVSGKVPDPAEAGADFPEAPREESVEQLMGEGPWMLVGLANDEVGYLIPKRQWDNLPPYAYGRSTAPYGEINSCGPAAAPTVMRALARRLSELPK